MTVLAFVDYWPGLSPYKEAKNGGYMDFAVMNYDYVNVQTSMEPYEVWFKLKDGASVQEFYDSIDKAGIKPLTLESASQQTIEKKNDPMLYHHHGDVHNRFPYLLDTLHKEQDFAVWYPKSNGNEVQRDNNDDSL